MSERYKKLKYFFGWKEMITKPIPTQLKRQTSLTSHLPQNLQKTTHFSLNKKNKNKSKWLLSARFTLLTNR